MKKLSKKLVLSSLSLGLAVATLSTTTYAWYTNNTSVAADGIQGTTDAGASAGLLISNAYNGTFSNSVTLTAADYTVDGTKMIPLEYKSGKLTERGITDAVAPANKGYLQFSVFVKATSDTDLTTAVPVYLKSLTISNTAATLEEFDIIKTYTDGFTASSTTYAVDAAQALNFTVAAQGLDSQPANKATTVGTDLYSVNSLVGTAKNKNLGTAADALTYYNTVMNLTGDDALTRTGITTATELTTIDAGNATSSTAITVASIADTKIYELTFTVWLDGWDQYCFDACKGQTFNISLALTTELKDVVVGK